MQFWQKTAKNKLYCGHTNKKYSILPIFHLIMCASMFAGISSVFSQFMPLELANVVIVIFFIMLCFGVKGASIINVAVSICLVLIVFLVVCEGGLVLLFPSDNSVFQSVLFAISYASMNIASSLPMIEYVCKRNSKKMTMLIAIVFGLVMFLLLFLMAGLSTSEADMPILSIIKTPWLSASYTVLIVFAMLSTLISCGVGAKKLFCSLSNFSASFFVSMLAMCVSFLGFKFIISYLYPALGFLVVLDFIIKMLRAQKHKNDEKFVIEQ